MNCLQEFSRSTSQNIDKDSNFSCVCDKPRKPKKTIEDEIADKQLKELFRRELKKDTMKECREGTYWRESFPDTSTGRKGHFLPPLKKFHTRLGADRVSKWNREDGAEEDEYRRTYYGYKKGVTHSKLKRAKGKDAHKKDKKNIIPPSKKNNIPPSKKNISSKGPSHPKKLNKNRDISSSYLNMDMSMFSYETDKTCYEDTNVHYLDMWNTNHVMKYYQLKKIAAKLEEHDLQVIDHVKNTVSFDFKNGYQLGLIEGQKQSITTQPIYVDDDIKDFVADNLVHEDIPYSESAYEDSIYNNIPNKKDKHTTIYISMDEEQLADMKEIYKHIDIQIGPNRQQLSTATPMMVKKKIENCISTYIDMSLTEKSYKYVEGFIKGYTDGFNQKFIFDPTEPVFNLDEMLYVNEVRKCVLSEALDIDNNVDIDIDIDIDIDKEAILGRAEELKNELKDIIDFDAYEKDIEEMKLTTNLFFTKSDFVFYYSYTCKKKVAEIFQPEYPKSKSAQRRRVVSPETSTTTTTTTTTTTSITPDIPMKRKGKTGNNRAWDYFNKHNIKEIFRYLGTMLCSHKPDDPIDYLIKLLDKCILFRENELHNAPLIFTKKHVESIYSDMDPFNAGFIDGTQYLYGLNLLDVIKAEDMVLIQQTRTVDRNLFLMNANDRLLEKFRIMIAIC